MGNRAISSIFGELWFSDSAADYSDAQLQKIELSAVGIQTLRDRMDELESLIQQDEWVNIRTFIHGPLGDLRSKTNYLTQSLLLPKDKTPVLKIGRAHV